MAPDQGSTRTNMAVELAGIQYAVAGVQRAAIDYYVNYYKDDSAIEDLLELLDCLSKKLTHPQSASKLRGCCEELDKKNFEASPDADHCVWPWRHLNDEECVFDPST